MKISTPAKEGPFQAAKWVKLQALVDPEELFFLMQGLEPFSIYPLAGALPLDAFPMAKEVYLSTYREWIEGLKKGQVPTQFGCLNASMWTQSPDALWLQELPSKRFVARPKAPFLQVQVHHMGYSLEDRVFRPMSLSQDAIFWGLQFSFPQLFEHPEQGILQTTELDNAHLFQIVRKWSRDYTIATPMNGDGQKENIPIRIGKRCLDWINSHPGLQAKGLYVSQKSS